MIEIMIAEFWYIIGGVTWTLSKFGNPFGIEAKDLR